MTMSGSIDILLEAVRVCIPGSEAAVARLFRGGDLVANGEEDPRL